MNLLANLNRGARLAVGALALSLVAACGGGNRVEPFSPTRMLAFGDESSVVVDSNNDANGRKYTINALKADNVTLDCSANAIWIQYVAATFSFALPQCNPNGVANPASRIYAAPGAKAADLAAQIDTHLLSDTFSGTDIVTVQIGANDVLAQYALYDGSNEAALTVTLQAAGIQAAAQVNRMAAIGGKVIVATAPDMGLTPFAIAQGVDRAALLTRLTAAFNDELRGAIINDGHMIGLVLADEVIQAAVKLPSLYSMVDWTQVACDTTKAATVLDCTSQTLVTGAAAGTWLWADATHLSPGGHRLIGQLAQTRAVNNPF
jgi:lysophospholipase L1-like esterase